MQIEFDHPTRGKHYQQANDAFPHARRREIDLMLQSIGAKPGEHIVEFGCGSGVITKPLAQQVGRRGRIYAYDNSRAAIAGLRARVPHDNVESHVMADERIPLSNGSVDAVITMANFHHVVDKHRIFREFSRVLKREGRVVIGDVADETAVQRFFDGPVDRFCSTGHRHPFVNPALAWNLCSEADLEFASWDLAYVPWEFRDESEAARFIHLLFDATSSPEECLREAKQYLGYRVNGTFLLHWQLFFMVARKKCAVPSFEVAVPTLTASVEQASAGHLVQPS